MAGKKPRMVVRDMPHPFSDSAVTDTTAIGGPKIGTWDEKTGTIIPLKPAKSSAGTAQERQGESAPLVPDGKGGWKPFKP